MTPRMIVMATSAAVMLLVLSMTAFAFNVAARNVVANRAESKPTPTASASVAPLATDEDIEDVYKDDFPSLRLLNGGASPIVFITVSSDNDVDNAAIINSGKDDAAALSGVEEITLVLTYNNEPYLAEGVSKLVDNSSANQNQLIVELD